MAHMYIYIYIIMLSYMHKIYMPHVFTHTIKRKSTFMTDAIVIHIETQ